MGLLYLLEKIRLPGLNELMLLVTRLGEETAFLVLALIVFWCVDKRRGYYVLAVGFLGTITSQFMKICCRVPRPWYQDENFTILEQAREGAGGYSFPSGHTQSSIGTFGGIAVTSKSIFIRALCLAACILVPFSRMYVGVHTPLDVAVGAVISVVILLVMHPLVLGKEGKYLPYVLGAMTVIAVSYVIFLHLYQFPAEVYEFDALAETTPWESAAKNAYTLLGSLLGFLVVYTADQKWMHFSEKAVWWVQILKVVLGLVLVLVVKEGLSTPFTNAFGYFPGRAARYFLIVIVAGIVWPLCFPFLNKLSEKKN
jgi:hypothetical protein